MELRNYPLDPEFVRERFDYDSGLLIHRSREGNRRSDLIGKVAGGVDKSTGYRIVKIRCPDHKKRNFLNSYLVWVHQKGAQPVNTLDHRNRVRSDDRIDNLRDVTRIEQQLNREDRPKTNQKEFMGGAIAFFPE